MQFGLSDLSLVDILPCGRAIRLSAAGSTTVPGAAAIVHYLYAECGHPDNARSCALIRFYKTYSLGELEPRLQEFAKAQLSEVAPSDQMKCLTLVASTGQEP